LVVYLEKRRGGVAESVLQVNKYNWEENEIC
jgi:hypothetical protein